MSEALQHIQPATITRYELEVEDVIAQVQKIQRVMTAVMQEGEHFGKIPGVAKPSLWKPGAEKLCLTFRLDPQYASTETYDGKHLTVKSICTLWHIVSGQRMGSGEGSCSTKESKYAYRKSERTCPACGKETIRKSKYPPRKAPKTDPGGWWCAPNGGGCGAEFAHDDQAVTRQTVGRVANEDLADVYNTVLKMANKRALVAAVLNVTAASDIFTQDIEDLVEAGVIVPKPEATKADEKAEPAAFATARGEGTKDDTPPTNEHLITGAQRRRLWAVAKEHGWTQDDIRTLLGAEFQYVSTAAIERAHYDAVIARLEQGPGPIEEYAPADGEVA